MKRISEQTRNEYVRMYRKFGSDEFYKRLIGKALVDLNKYKNPHSLLLDAANSFTYLYRQTGYNDYYEIAKVLRRAGNKIYRELLRIRYIKEKDQRFLNVVK